MAGVRSCATCLTFLFLLRWSFVFSGPVNVSVVTVPAPLLRAALESLDQDSPTHHSYNGGNLINAQKLVEPPFVIWRLTFDLKPTCKDALESCPREACTLEVKQHELGDVLVQPESIQCMYLYPQSTQDNVQTQETISEQEVLENVEKQIVTNQSLELDHEVQAAGDQTEKPFIAVRASGSKYCPGCPYELNPTLVGLAVFTEQFADLLDESLPNDYKHKPIAIVKVTRAVPPSLNAVQYQVVLKIAESDCPKNAVTDHTECAVRPGAPIKTCTVIFEEQPWQRSNRQITKWNCTSAEENDEITMTSSNTQPENDAVTSPIDTRERMAALEGLRDSLQTFNYTLRSEKEPIEQRAPVTEDSATEIVLDRGDDTNGSPTGFIDKVKEFGEFLEDFGMSTQSRDDDATTNSRDVNEDATARSKRSSMRLGAPGNRDVTDPEIQEFARKGLHKFSQYSEGPNEPIIVNITEASSQVVAGMLYKIKVKLGTSNCPRGIKENCELKADSEIKECLFSVWSQPWKDQGSPEITINCDLNQRKRRSLRGSNYSLKMLQQAEDAKAEPLFNDFIRTYKKTYSDEERVVRFNIFKDNLRVIDELRKSEQGTGEYGINMFADLSREEFKAQYLGLRPDLQSENEIPYPPAEIPDINLPEEYDWRQYNVVTPVKNQGQCGSCWAFSVTGNVEGQYAIKHDKLLSLSEQELVDCDTLDEGCNGGLPDNAYRAIENLGGLELESDYPYDARNEKCHFNKKKATVQIASAVNITSDETSMAKWLVKNGPIAIGINANAMQFYIGGVSHPYKFLCNPKNLDHGVLIVGYGTKSYPIFHKELPYWIIKNSWGPHWGEQGYYRVYRGDGTCGLNTMASSAIVV